MKEHFFKTRGIGASPIITVQLKKRQSSRRNGGEKIPSVELGPRRGVGKRISRAVTTSGQ